MPDTIEVLGKNSLIQHGQLNNRIYLMKLDKLDFPDIIDLLNDLASKNNYTKIFCKIPFWAKPLFYAHGFMTEACIPNFYNNAEDVFFVSKFLNSDRLLGIENEKLSDLSNLLMSYKPNSIVLSISEQYSYTSLQEADTDEISKVYKQVFASYPFPIFDPKYIIDTMQNNVQYFGIKHQSKIVAVSSAEIDRKGLNAEMTDFATLPDFRGHQFAKFLLCEMEKSMNKQGVKTLFTIARLNSIPMNKTFLSLQYKYGGTLINNTNIAGKIESMNILYKHL